MMTGSQPIPIAATIHAPHGAGMQPVMLATTTNGVQLPQQLPGVVNYQATAMYTSTSVHPPLSTTTSHGYATLPSPHGSYNIVPASSHQGEQAATLEAIPVPTSLLTSVPSEPS
jgi:hypothetical protein